MTREQRFAGKCRSRKKKKKSSVRTVVVVVVSHIQRIGCQPETVFVLDRLLIVELELLCGKNRPGCKRGYKIKV